MSGIRGHRERKTRDVADCGSAVGDVDDIEFHCVGCVHGASVLEEGCCSDYDAVCDVRLGTDLLHDCLAGTRPCSETRSWRSSRLCTRLRLDRSVLGRVCTDLDGDAHPAILWVF